MRIEHIAFLADDPVKMAAWYGRHLGFEVVREAGAPHHTRFLADGARRVVLEVYRREELARPEYATWSPLRLHLAFVSDNVECDRDRLVEAGASLEEDVHLTAAGDRLCMLRDPFGLAVQLCQRRVPLVAETAP